jgi:arabinogalactan oligomer/maltooligosaccharide transport system permease protein
MSAVASVRTRDPLWKKLLVYAVLAVFVVIAVYPVLRILSISIRPGDRLLSTSLAVIPDDATGANYAALLGDTPFLRWLLNSTLVAIAVTFTGVALASTAGYALSRFKFRGRNAALSGILITQMFPATMLLLPLFLMLTKLGLLNSYLGLVVIYTATALPFCVWQMKGYYDTIPPALEEAARIDGCSPWQAFYKVVFPLAAPALVITALFSFMSAWNEYVVAAVVLQDAELFTLPVGLKLFQGSMTTQWGLYAAGSLLVSIPVVALFLVLSRYLISGLTLGAVKG